MRDSILVALVLGSLPVYSAWPGLRAWCWLGYMNPQRRVVAQGQWRMFPGEPCNRGKAPHCGMAMPCVGEG